MAGYYAHSASFRSASRQREDVDPLSLLANLSDAMLVFAVGLLMALVVAFNVNLGSASEVSIDESADVTDQLSSIENSQDGGSSYVERGTVYEDPRTGRLYMLEDGSQDAGSSDASSSTSSSDGQ